jgi:uncharacterized membrane-anchored protein
MVKNATSNIQWLLVLDNYLLQLRAFSHIMSSMTTKLVIYGVIDLIISSSVFSIILKYFLPLTITTKF